MSKKPKQGPSEKKTEKTKIIYYDDDSTVVDMYGTKKSDHLPPRKKSTFKEKSRTFFTVMKRMVVPMLCTLAAFTLIYLILLWIAG